MKQKSNRRFLFLLAVGSLLPAQSAHAEWLQSASGTYEYNAAANWFAGTIDDSFPASLSIAGNQVLTFDADRVLPGAWSFLYDGTGNLTLRGDAAARTATLGGNFTLDSVSNGRTVTIGSTVAAENLNVALGAAARTFDIGTSDTATLVNSVSGGLAAGNVSILKTGAGTLAFGSSTVAAVSTFTGNIQINSGVFSAIQNEASGTSNTVLGDVTNDIILNGGTFRSDLNHNGTGRFANGRVITVNAVAGNVLDTPTRLNLGFSNQLTGSGALTKIGSDRLDIFQTVNYAGTISVQQGMLSLRIAGALNSATINLTGGTLNIGTSGGSAFTTPVNISANSAIQPGINTAGAGVTHSFGALTVGANIVTVDTVNITSGTQTTSFTTTTLTGTPTFIVNNPAGATNSLTLSGVVSGSFGINKQGTGTLNLNGNNNYTGVTAITGGAVAITNSNSLGTTAGNTTIAADGTSNSARLLISGGITSAENITLTGTTERQQFQAAIVNTGGINTLSGNITLAGTAISGATGLKISASGGTLNLTGDIINTTTTHTLVLQPSVSTAQISVTKAIANNGGGLLLVGQNSTLGALVTLSGASGNGIGATTLGQNVTLRLGVNDALNTTANLTISYGGTTTGEDRAVFDLRGFNQTVNALIGNVGTGASPSANSLRVVTNGVAGTSILTVGNGGGSGTFRGQINSGTGNIQLIKVGAGNQTLIDQNSYTGGTRIDGGTLTLGHATNTLANTGAVNVNGGTLAIGANSDTVGVVTLTSGSITGSTGVLTGSSYAVESGSVSAILGGTSVGLTKTTTGTVTLSGTNTYTGATTVSAGKLVIDGNNSAATGIVTVADMATLGGGGTVGGATTINAGGIVSPGNSIGTLSFSGNLTIDGTYLLETATSQQADLLDVNGILNLGAASVLDLDSLSSLMPTDTYVIADYTGGSLSGFFSSVDSSITATHSVAYDYNSGTQIALVPIPEPSTLVLGGLALLGFARAGLRKRRLAK